MPDFDCKLVCVVDVSSNLPEVQTSGRPAPCGMPETCWYITMVDMFQCPEQGCFIIFKT